MLGARGPEHSPAPKEAPRAAAPTRGRAGCEPEGERFTDARGPEAEETKARKHGFRGAPARAGRPSGVGALGPTRWVRAQAQP